MMTFWYNFAVKLCSKQMDGNYPTLPKLGNPYLCFNLPLSVNILLFCKLLRLLEDMLIHLIIRELSSPLWAPSCSFQTVANACRSISDGTI